MEKKKNKSVDLPKLIKAVNKNNGIKGGDFRKGRLTVNILYKVINEYEMIDRDILAYNLRKAMGTPFISYPVQDKWLAKACDTNKETIYSWLAANRNAKAPLKAVVIIARALGLSIYDLLAQPSENEDISLSKRSYYDNSYEGIIVAYRMAFPRIKYGEIAKDLGISDVTVRRHLINYEKRNKNV